MPVAEEIERLLRVLAYSAFRWIQEHYHVSWWVAALIVCAVIAVGGLCLFLAARGVEWFLKTKGGGVIMTKAEFARQSLAWAAVFAALSYLAHPALLHNIEYRLGLGMPWLPDLCWFAAAFGVAITYLTHRIEGLVAAAWKKFLSDIQTAAVLKSIHEILRPVEEEEQELPEEG